MLGVAHELITRDLHDRAFLERYTVGFDRLSAYIHGQGRWRREVPRVGIACDRARTPANPQSCARMAQYRTLITVGWALQRADHGEQCFWMAAASPRCWVQIGLPGGGVGYGYTSSGRHRQWRVLGRMAVNAGRAEPGRCVHPGLAHRRYAAHAGRGVRLQRTALRIPAYSLIYWAGGNPFHHHQDINRLIDAWRRPETIIVHEHVWNAHARHADIVLPAANQLERNDIAATGRDRFLSASHRLFEPVGEARTDFEIFRSIAARLGVS